MKAIEKFDDLKADRILETLQPISGIMRKNKRKINDTKSTVISPVPTSNELVDFEHQNNAKRARLAENSLIGSVVNAFVYGYQYIGSLFSGGPSAPVMNVVEPSAVFRVETDNSVSDISVQTTTPTVPEVAVKFDHDADPSFAVCDLISSWCTRLTHQ